MPILLPKFNGLYTPLSEGLFNASGTSIALDKANKFEINLFSLITIAAASHGIQGIDKKLHIEGIRLIEDSS